MKNSIFWTALGALFLVFGIGLLLKAIIHKVICNQKTVARVIAFDVKEEIRTRQRYYRPIFEYQVGNEKVVGKCNKFTKMENRYQIGEEINLRYNPNNPEECDLQDAFGDIILSVFVILMGALFMYVLRF